MIIDYYLCVTDNPWIRFHKSRVSLFAGESYTLDCRAWGIPPPAVKWLRNGQELLKRDLNGTISIAGGAAEKEITLKLQFSNVEPQHAGNYTCEARNKYNKRKRNLTVLVSCKLILFI